MKLLILFLGQMPEAIFFALFMIFAKNLREKRIPFILLMVVEYLLIMRAFPYSWIFHILYLITTFLTLKILYKEKSQITDIFILIISYAVMIISSILCFIISGGHVILANVIHKVLIFTLLFLFRNRLYNVQNLYKKYWNRNDKISKRVKSVTFRSLNIVTFNILFYALNGLMLYAVYYNSKL